MPLRTRDFLLYLLSFAFLVIAIFVTIAKDIHLDNNNAASVVSAPSDSEVVKYPVTTEEEPVMDRAGHLAALRSKIAEFKETMVSPATPAEPEPLPVNETTVEEPVEVLTDPLNCPGYQNFSKPWSPSGLNFSVVEGARLLYREVEVAVQVGTTSATTTPETVTKEVVLQLPLQTYPGTTKSCLSGDVVGVALDGSLIKNNEQGLYSIFSAETLIGYALDGFPIYGQGELKTDECGGILVDGQYRYYLSSEREAVLYCYSGIPVEI